jgi:hypothetical protein
MTTTLRDDLRERITRNDSPARVTTARKRPRFPCATEQQLTRAEAELGFALPSLLRRLLGEVANGGFGPGFGLFGVEGGQPATIHADPTALSEAYVRMLDDETWPRLLLPICDWGCATWSCLDCRIDDGLVVTMASAELACTERTLGSWLRAWLDGVDLDAEMFEPGPVTISINPFTKQPLKLVGQGKLRGRPFR